MSESGICPVCNQGVCVCSIGSLPGIAGVSVEVHTLRKQLNELRGQVENTERIKLSTLSDAWDQAWEVIDLSKTGFERFHAFIEALKGAGVQVTEE